MESLTPVTPLDHDFTLEVPTRNRHWYEVDGYEPLSASIFGAACRDADVVIDIGAHIGFYAVLAARRNPEARVVAVEASPENAIVVEGNAARNGWGNIEVRNAAFHSTEGSVWLEVTEASDNCGLSGHPDSATIDRVEVPAITARSLQIRSDQRIVVKLDVEGHELAALSGLESLLEEARALHLLVEFNPKCIRAAEQDPWDVLHWLWDRGYRIYALHEGAYRWHEWTVEDAAADPVGDWYVNLWCVPKKAAQSTCAVLHAAATSGAELSHLQMVTDLIADGRMVHTVVPEPDQGLVPMLKRAGSTVSVVPTYSWWAVAEGDDGRQPSRTWMSDLFSPQVIDAVRSSRPDLVITQSVVIPQGAVAAAAVGVPHVWYLREFADLDHGLQLPVETQTLGRIVRRLSARVLCNSAAVRQHFFRDDPSAATVVPPIPRLMTSAASSARVSPDFTVGIVGSLQAGKGHVDALEAAALLSAQGSRLHLVLVGGGALEDVERLRKRARELGVEDLVTFTGQSPPGVPFYSMMDAVAVTSRCEAFGRVPFEATEAGLPVVYAASGGVIEYMVDGSTGLAYAPGDPSALARNINELIKNPRLGRDLVEGARSMAKSIREGAGSPSVLISELDAAASQQSRSDNFLDIFLGWSATGIEVLMREHDEAEARRREAQSRQADAAAREAAIAMQRDQLRRILDDVSTDRDVAHERLAAALEELAEIHKSRSWRLTAHLRHLKGSIVKQAKEKN